MGMALLYTYIGLQCLHKLLYTLFSYIQYMDITLHSYKCHRHGKWIRKEMKRFGAFVVFGILAWMPVDTQMNHGGSNVHVQWFSCWKMQADDHDILA